MNMTPAKEKKKSRKSILLRLIVPVLAVYAVVVLVDMQVTLSQKKLERDELRQQHEVQRLENKELERQIAAGVDEDYIERFARDNLDYVSPDQRVFIDISGS
jgi:cell division protein FtsB